MMSVYLARPLQTIEVSTDLSGASLLGRLACQGQAHSSLFAQSISDEEKSFLVETWSRSQKTFML
jgi:hypothetical protein